MFLYYEHLFERMVEIGDDSRDDGYVFGKRPFKMWFNGLTLQNSVIGGVDCSSSTLSAVYKELERVKGVEYSSLPAADRLPKEFYVYWVPYGEYNGSDSYEGQREASAGAAHTHLEATVGDGGTYNTIAELKNIRRGDVAQIWWEGVAAGSPKKFEGHGVFIHDVRVNKDGEVVFQILSAQGNTDTHGVGVGRSKVEDYKLTESVQAKLYGKGRWYRYKAGDRTDKYAIVPEMHVARFQREFPRWPCALATSTETIGPLVDPAQAPLYCDQNERKGRGGYFPIGSNRTWHGGIHLRPGKKSAVYAIADGVIVAARCPEVDDALEAERKKDPKRALPSRNFVLVRHEVKIGDAKKVFYSLVMHLAGDLTPAEAFPIRWLWQVRQNGGGQVVHLDGAKVLKLAHPIGAGEILGLTEGDDVHVEIFSEECFPDFAGIEKIEEKAGDKDLFVDQSKLLDFIDEKFDIKNLIQDTWWGGVSVKSDGMITAEEIRTFFLTHPERAKMRLCATKHVSEWSDQITWDLSKGNHWGYLSKEALQATTDLVKLYGWLTADIATHAKLPSSHQHWHYHPITFLKWLREKVSANGASNVVQDVTPFLTGAKGELAMPSNVHWAIDDDAKDKDDEPLTALKLFEGTASKPGGVAKKADGTFETDPGPWTQLGAKVTQGDGEFIRVSDAPKIRWICVKWGSAKYAEERGSA